MTGLKNIINQLRAKLKIGKSSTTKRFKKAEQERELSDKDRSSEDIQHQMSCPHVTIQIEVAAETRASASTERVAALDSQLSKTQVNWKLRIGLMYL
jgi:hypothetical protein